MRLGGRAQAAIEVLDDIDDRHRPASLALRDWGLSHRFAGSGDRAAIGNLVYDSLRRRASQRWRMDSDDNGDLVCATLLGQWGYAADELAGEFAADPHAPPPPSTDRLAAWRSRDLAAAPDHVRADVPHWCAGQLAASFGAGWVGEAQAFACRPPLDLRVNTLKASRDKVLRALARFHARPTDHSPVGVRIAPGTRGARLPNVQAEAGYQKGWFEVQDEGSQIAALATGARPGEQVLDYCAGAGGKTLALSALMENRGQVHAHDADRMRLAPIHERLRRAGARNVQVVAPDAEMAVHTARMDCVLVDAPCTGSGVWRRHPDAKWRLDEAALAARLREQDAVLAGAAAFVRPGGRLVYVTCSVFAAENAERVAAFVARQTEFRLAAPGSLPAAACAIAQTGSGSESMVTLSPASTGADGFFLAMLERAGGASSG